MSRTSRKRRRSLARKLSVGSWVVGLLLAAGYLPMRLTGMDPRISIVLAAVAAIPLGMRARSIARGGLWGAAAGLTVAVGVVTALTRRGPVPIDLAGKYLGALALFCGAVAALFAYLRRRRLARIEDEWRNVR